METNPSRSIEVFAPCSAAFDLTKLILFQPFDLGKWFVIGFAAFLSHLAGGGGAGFNYNSRLGRADWKFHSWSNDFGWNGGMPGWVIPLIGVGILVGLVIVLLFAWVGSRGKFILTDCIVRNRGAIEEPWREYRQEGNSYFLFTIAVGVIMLCLFTIVGIPLWLPFLLHGEGPEGLGLVLGLGLFLPVFLVAALGIKLTFSFMVPVMYRRRCRALEAFQAALRAIMEHPGPVILYLLFLIVLWLAFAMISCLTTCLTCCITAIPYIGTVILLPAYVFFAGYLLLFLRQFGPDFDAWANVAAIPAPTIPAEPPPVQPSPPLPPA